MSIVLSSGMQASGLNIPLIITVTLLAILLVIAGIVGTRKN
jgi:hypothetical protein